MRLSQIVRLRHANTYDPTGHDDPTWGGLTLVLKGENKSLAVDRDQHYLVIHQKGKRWHDGTWQRLGPIGRERALERFDTL